MPKKLNSSQSIAEQLGGTEDICLITKDILEEIIHENASSQRKQLEISNDVAKSMSMIAAAMVDISTHLTVSSKAVCDKMDILTETIKQNNASFTSFTSSPTNVEDQLKQHKSLTEKIVRHEILAKYYDELLNEPTPFARKEFRTKVNKNASEIDLRHRRQQTIDNVKTEIKIMEERAADFSEKRKKISEKIEQYLQRNEDSRAEITEKIASEERKAKDDYEREKLSLIKRTDDDEKRTIFEYLLSFQGEESYDNRDNQKNYRGRSYKGRRRPYSRD